MKRIRRSRWAAGLIAAAVATALISFCLVLFLRTAAFRGLSRERVVAAIERATGSKAELGSLDFDWNGSTAILRNLVIHGTERADEPPLLRIAVLQVKLSWRSLLNRKLDASHLEIGRPELHLSLNLDGSTNLPKIATQGGSVINRFFDLHVGRYDLSDGIFVVNREERAFSIHGQDLTASLDSAGGAVRAYTFHLGTPSLKIKARCCQEWPLQVTAAGLVEPDSLRFDNVRLSGNGATLQASGTLRDFARPIGEFTYQAQTTAAALSTVTNVPDLRSGDFAASGKAHFDQSTGLLFGGKLQVHDLTYVSRDLRVPRANAEGDFHFENGRIEVQPLRARLLGGTFTGTAILDDLHLSSLAGRLAHLKLRAVTDATGIKTLPYNASLDGGLSVSASDGLNSDLVLQPQGDPSQSLSGRISLRARSKGDFEFATSHLDLANTKLDFQGSPRQGFKLALTSSDLTELRPVLAWLHVATDPSFSVPDLLPGGKAQFDGILRGSSSNLLIDGALVVSNFHSRFGDWERLQWRGQASNDSLIAAAFSLEGGQKALSGSGSVALHQWRATADSQWHLKTGFHGIDLAPFLSSNTILSKAVAAGTIDVSGSLPKLTGEGHLRLTDLLLYGEQIPRLRADLSIMGNVLHISRGVLGDRQGNDLAFSGVYAHSAAAWRTGEYTATVSSKRFELAHLTVARKFLPDATGILAADATLAGQITPAGFNPTEGHGTVNLRNLSLDGEAIGNVQAQLQTRAGRLEVKLSGDVRGNGFSGDSALQLGETDPLQGSLQFSRVPLSLLHLLPFNDRVPALEADGFASGSIAFQGALNSAQPWHSSVRLAELEASRRGASNAFMVRNAAPVAFEFGDGHLRIQSLRLRGPETEADISGSLDYHQAHVVNLNVNGSLSLQLLSLFDPGLEANGTAEMQAAIRGTLDAPTLAGDLRIANGSIVPTGFSNGLSKLNGTLTFDQNRATIRTLTAEAGGGQLSLGGFVAFAGRALSYHVDARAQNTRLRSDSGISVTADATLRLTGDSTNSLLAGNISVSRVVFTPNTDVGNLLSSFAAPAPAGQSKILSSLQMDLGVQSTPNLQVNTALSRDMGADVSLRLRGSPDHPVLLGSISANQGEVRVFGTRYTINRGEVTFLNPSHIDPVLDLDLQTEARGINVDITISGTLDRLNVNYRSDPPLQPRDIIALLAVGRTPQEAANVQSSQVGASDTTALQAGASSVLGQAISPPSNRLSKLFGVTNIKLDPLVQGITSTPQSRLTLEQQISRAITVTYVTNLEQTSEQIFRLEWSISREYSVVAVRDDNGEFGIDFQYKRRFK